MSSRSLGAGCGIAFFRLDGIVVGGEEEEEEEEEGEEGVYKLLR